MTNGTIELALDHLDDDTVDRLAELGRGLAVADELEPELLATGRGPSIRTQISNAEEEIDIDRESAIRRAVIHTLENQHGGSSAW